MADVTIWQNKKAREAFITRGKKAYEKIKDELADKEGVVAIHPDSGDYFVGKTLGTANAAAYEKHPDQWVYFVRLEDPGAAIPLPTW
jgi:predicted ribonuclease toxin of YeeF-YezG toxin-antitoxin module